MARYDRHDKFYRKAREQGLPSRAAFKLDELLTRFHLIRPHARVADLGCAPGGWLAILSRAVGPDGLVVGVDLSPCTNVAPNVSVIRGDIRDSAVRNLVVKTLSGRAEFITSDLSPKLTGIAERDQAAVRELLDATLDFADDSLKPGAALLVKIFMGAEFESTRALFDRCFATVDVVRTRASRPGSAELYLVARGFNPDR